FYMPLVPPAGMWYPLKSRLLTPDSLPGIGRRISIPISVTADEPTTILLSDKLEIPRDQRPRGISINCEILLNYFAMIESMVVQSAVLIRTAKLLVAVSKVLSAKAAALRLTEPLPTIRTPSTMSALACRE